MCIVLFLTLFSYIYEDSDSLIVIQDTLLICGYHYYGIKTHISDQGVLSVRPYLGSDSTGWLSVDAQTITIEKASRIAGSEAGFWGGSYTHPDGYGPGYGHAGNTGGGAGGGAGYGGSGGAGGGIPGSGGIVYGSATDTSIAMGSGGGAGRLGSVEGFGGSGGGFVCLRGTTVRIESSTVEVYGGPGGAAAVVAGGGGSGGGLMVASDSVSINYSNLIAEGGAGGTSDGYGGGGGGGGRIKVFFSSHLDTAGFVTSALGGIAGYGAWESGEAGDTGSVLVEPIVGTTENKAVRQPRIVHCFPFANSHVVIYCEYVPISLLFYDSSGRRVKRVYLEHKTNTVAVHDLPQGVYFIVPSGYPCSSTRLTIIRR